MTDTKKRSRFASIFEEPSGNEKKPKLEEKPAAPAAAAATAARPPTTPQDIAAMLEEKKRKVAELLQRTGMNPAIQQQVQPIPTIMQQQQQQQQQQTNIQHQMVDMSQVLAALEKAKSSAQQRIGPLVGMKLGTSEKTKKAMTLKLDELGRPVDEHGNVIGLPNKEVISSLKVNQRMNKGKLKIEKPVLETDPERNPFYDTNIKMTSRHKERNAFSFHEPGTFEKLAQQYRAKAQLAKLQKDLEEKAKKAGIDALVDLTGSAPGRVIEPPQIPEVEWWDSFFLHDYSYDGIEQEGGIKGDVVNHLVQHPVPVKPPGYREDTPPKELMLTAKERKKLRRQRRQELQRETQEKIALGLMKPPPPKVTMSNFMRVMGNDAIQDPTRMEKIAREQVEKRFKEHMAANEARKLTPQQRKEKMRLKLEKDAQLHGLHVAVFRIKDLSRPQHKFKVDANAQQYHLTGCGILYKNMNLIVVEGGPQAIRKYKKLMLHRIKWNEASDGAEDEEEEEEEGEEDEQAGSKDVVGKSSGAGGENECILVWEGEVKKPAFKAFRFKQCATELLIINFLDKFGVPDYWNFAKNFSAD